MTRPLRASHALACAFLLGACSRIADIDDRARVPAGVPATANAPTDPPAHAAPDGGSERAGDTDPATADASAESPRAPEALLTLGEDPELAQDASALYVWERAGERSRIHRIAKTKAHETALIYDEPFARSTGVSALAVKRNGELFASTYDGFLRTMRAENGSGRSVASSGPSEIVASSSGTVWLASPDLTDLRPKLSWLGDPLLSRVPEASVDPGLGVFAAEATDDELVFVGRTSNQIWKVLRWRPFASSEPLTTLQTYPEYITTMTTDADRVYLHAQDEGSIVAFSRVTPNAPVVPILGKVEAPSYPLMLASDGRVLYLRTQNRISACLLERCAASMTTVDAGFTRARWLLRDAEFLYYLRKDTSDGPFVLYRAPLPKL